MTVPWNNSKEKKRHTTHCTQNSKRVFYYLIIKNSRNYFNDLLKCASGVLQPLKEEYDRIMEDKAREEEERQAALREREEMVQSATFITSLYRAYKARQRIRAERRRRRKK